LVPRNLLTDRWQAIAGLNGFMAIAMGAVGAHAVANGHLAGLVEHASFYQLIHAVLLVSLAASQGRCMRLARGFILLGIILFCGSLYCKGLNLWPDATRAAPMGGVCLMLGWLCIAADAYKKSQQSTDL
jgi:uncharacterized membrane protein YgdD (TMEM256/DUF423 family)